MKRVVLGLFIVFLSVFSIRLSSGAEDSCDRSGVIHFTDAALEAKIRMNMEKTFR